MAAWNARVNPEDTVYHLGDFAMGDRRLIPQIVSRLAGHKVLVMGNHDRPRSVEGHFEAVLLHHQLEIDGLKVSLRHAPNRMDPWAQNSRDLVEEDSDNQFDIYLHGHVHNRWARRGKFINVGVDVRDFEPKTFHELLSEWAPTAGL